VALRRPSAGVVVALRRPSAGVVVALRPDAVHAYFGTS